MKRITAIALFTVANLVTVGSVLAQDPVEATVPFAFTVGTKLLPSGTYTISSQVGSAEEILLIQNRSQGIAVFAPAHADLRKSKHGELVFHKYGDQYFLSEILCTSCNLNMELPTSKVETRAQLQKASLHGVDQVLVALK